MNPVDDNRRELARIADELLEQAAAVRRHCEEIADMLGSDQPDEPGAADDVFERKAG